MQLFVNKLNIDKRAKGLKLLYFPNTSAPYGMDFVPPSLAVAMKTSAIDANEGKRTFIQIVWCIIQ